MPGSVPAIFENGAAEAVTPAEPPGLSEDRYGNKIDMRAGETTLAPKTSLSTKIDRICQTSVLTLRTRPAMGRFQKGMKHQAGSSVESIKNDFEKTAARAVSKSIVCGSRSCRRNNLFRNCKG
jgi:hypothetical protein